MTSSEAYDQYADQLLNSVFQNVKRTTTPAPSMHDDQLFNQLLQNARYSNNMSSPSLFNNNNNDWLLMQQLQQQQQQMLLERQFMSPNHQTSLLSSPITELLNAASNATPIPTSPSSAIASPVPVSDIAIVEDPAPPAKKIARVPVPSLPEPKPVEEPLPQQIPNVNHQPQLKKKKSFLRSLSSRPNRNKEFKAVAVPMLTKSAHQQYKDKKKDNVLKKQPVIVETRQSLPPPVIDRKPSFWRPREDKPKGWWKGERSHPQQEEYQEIEVEEIMEEEVSEEEEEEQVVVVPPKKTKKVVVKRVAVPVKKVPSIKAAKPKRPMAFKTPTRKHKVSEKKSSSNEKTDTSVAKQPMYVMPQQMYQPFYQQPMMMVPQPQPYIPGGNGLYYMPNMMMPPTQAVEKEEEPQIRRNKSVYNPRETSNDKCNIM